jgi:hypothetical protein
MLCRTIIKIINVAGLRQRQEKLWALVARGAEKEDCPTVLTCGQSRIEHTVV